MPKKNSYDVISMERAIQEVKNSNMSYMAAANKYGVPKSTLEFKIKNPGHKSSCGPSPILSVREEYELVRWIEELASRGFPRKKEDILNSVQKFLTENPLPNPFVNNRPGDCWLKRNPSITQRTSESVSAASACVAEKDIRKWFTEIKNYLDSKNITMEDPSRVYNGDETGFQICPNTGKVFAAKGAKNVYSVEKGSPKENITVMFSFSASGVTCPPMIVYPYKRVPEKISMTVNPDWGIGRSDNGWMTADTFYEYIKNVFHPFLVERGATFPIVLFLDGHKSHLTYELSILCSELNIEVIALYPNATRILQPCDVAVFRPIKMGWKKAVREFNEQNPGEIVNKISFAPLLENVVNNIVKAETLINGFRACGLFPFNPDSVDYSKCLGKENTSPEESLSPHMDKKTFINFVGENLITKFKLLDDILTEGISEEFRTLYNIWMFFGKPNFSSNQISLLPEAEASPKTIRVLENIVLKVPNITEAPHDTSTSLTTSTSKIIGSCLQVPEELGPISMNEVTGNMSQTSDAPVPSPIIDSNNDVTCQTSSSSLTRKPIENYLKIPDKPQRKNKRQIERVSFAITSRVYQESLEAKKAAKLKKENEKLERKRKREEKVALKASSKNKIVCKQKDPELTCSVCKTLIGKQKTWQCDTCKRSMHNSCVPKKHQKHLPDVDDNGLFCVIIAMKREVRQKLAVKEVLKNSKTWIRIYEETKIARIRTAIQTHQALIWRTIYKKKDWKMMVVTKSELLKVIKQEGVRKKNK
nr:unnamed protein product [Callosobruchus chinensis]